MKKLEEIEEKMKEGDVFTLNQVSEPLAHDASFFATVDRNRKNAFRIPLRKEAVEKFASVFPRIKFFVEYHAYYFETKYDSKKGTFSSSIMTGCFNAPPQAVQGLVGNADNLMDSMMALEERIAMRMKSSKALQRIKL